MLPVCRLSFVFSVCRLVSRRCHIISTFHQLAPAPRRTVLAQLTHTAPQTIIRALIERPDAEQFCGHRFSVRPVFPYSARPCVASFSPAALPAFAGTTRRSDSLSLICLPPFGRLFGILSVSLLLTALSCSSERKTAELFHIIAARLRSSDRFISRNSDSRATLSACASILSASSTGESSFRAGPGNQFS